MTMINYFTREPIMVQTEFPDHVKNYEIRKAIKKEVKAQSPKRKFRFK